MRKPVVPTPVPPTPKFRVGLLSTFPPKLCGLATFASALAGTFAAGGHRVDVVRITDGHHPLTGPPVVADLVNGDPESIRAAAAVLSAGDVAVIQHEYGIYGGPDGDEVLDLLRALTCPSVVILHTVPLQPTEHQRQVLMAVTDLADRVVVMSLTAADRLTGSYAVAPGKVCVIPHGVSAPTGDRRLGDFLSGRHPQLLTWGLLGPGKGIEHAIDALAMMTDIRRRPHYTVAGVTHPNVFARDGDQYRRSLVQRAKALGISGSVAFDDTYRDVPDLMRFVASSAVVILPYDSREQVTSGVLVDAIAAGRPVIATAFPHAVELLASGAGIVVPHGDPAALAEAIRSVLTDDDLYASMVSEARRVAPTLWWTAVAERYVTLFSELSGTDRAVAR